MNKIFGRINQYLFFAVLFVVVLHFGRQLLIPLSFAALLSMLMAPVCRKLDNRGLHRGLSTFICVFIIILAMAAFLAIISGQFVAFAEDFPKMKEKGQELLQKAQSFIEQEFGIPPAEQEELAKGQAKSAATSGGSGGGGGLAAKIVGGIVGLIGGVALTLVFTFLMLFNKEHFENFFVKLYRNQDEERVRAIVGKIATVAQKYLTGRVMSILINATLYAIGLSIVGIENAILLACVAAILTLIPYVGTVIGGLIPVLMALVTENSFQPALYAAGVLFLVQTIDNYFIEPNIVGGEVDLAALTTIVVLIAGGLIWGPAGLILFLPFTGIVKIVSDHVDELAPLAHLLGEPGGHKPSKIKKWITEKVFRK